MLNALALWFNQGYDSVRSLLTTVFFGEFGFVVFIFVCASVVVSLVLAFRR